SIFSQVSSSQLLARVQKGDFPRNPPSSSSSPRSSSLVKSSSSSSPLVPLSRSQKFPSKFQPLSITYSTSTQQSAFNHWWKEKTNRTITAIIFKMKDVQLMQQTITKGMEEMEGLIR
ncbi:unnamed protein product, partial [Linum tenue]